MIPELRPGTDDAAVWEYVHGGNEYALPADMNGWVVLDVGGHVGSFACACLERGARVTSHEPCAGSRALLLRNAARVDPAAERFEARPEGVARSEGGGTLVTGGLSPSGYSLCRAGPGESVRTVTLGTAVTDCLCHWGADRIDLLKFDAEGSEYDVFSEGVDLSRVRRLAVELHGSYGGGPAAAEILRRRFAACGFVQDEWRTCHEEFGWLRLYRGSRP